MKKMIFALSMVLFCQMSFAQDVRSIINDFKDVDGATYIVSGKDVMNSQEMKEVFDALKIDTKGFVVNSSEFLMLDGDNCSPKVCKKYVRKVDQLKKGRYDVLLSQENSNLKVNVYGWYNDNLYQELVVAISFPEDNLYMLTKFNGSFMLDSFTAEKLVNFSVEKK